MVFCLLLMPFALYELHIRFDKQFKFYILCPHLAELPIQKFLSDSTKNTILFFGTCQRKNLFVSSESLFWANYMLSTPYLLHTYPYLPKLTHTTMWECVLSGEKVSLIARKCLLVKKDSVKKTLSHDSVLPCYRS